MAHFSDCGKHCEDPYCRQQDLLPLQCNACGKTYCSNHFSYEAHSCPKGRKETDKRVIVCPLCQEAIPLPFGEDENEVWERHFSTTCRPKTTAATGPPRCPVRGCKEKLTFSNSCTCDKCKLKVCLKHRYEEDHECRPSSNCRTSARRASESRTSSGFLAQASGQLRRLIK
eukprot:TRINITY_DN51890_c0_g1_i1.p1 TRINITY_DN51890_c0_g1~~TRINITY_DN51890_c0_g1_i1.p1  ORF type:complete len:193 (+),score=22.71 TRINITY_DN51890_c0_g1_i1:69-581(+)